MVLFFGLVFSVTSLLAIFLPTPLQLMCALLDVKNYLLLPKIYFGRFKTRKMISAYNGRKLSL